MTSQQPAASSRRLVTAVALSALAALLPVPAAAMAADPLPQELPELPAAEPGGGQAGDDPVGDLVRQAPGPVQQVLEDTLGIGSPAPEPRQGGGGSSSSSGTAPQSSGGGGDRQSGSGSVAPAPADEGGSGAGAPRSGSGSGDRPAAGDGSARSGALAPAAARERSDGAGATAVRALPADDGRSGITGAIREVVEVVPGPLKVLLGLLGGLVLILGGGYLLTTRRARRLSRQRSELLEEVGLLQQALLPEVPAQLGGAAASVAYRPADGPGAGGDFYDAFELASGAVAVIVGDVSGHGRDSLARTTLIRYTLRAYLDAGLGPRAALQVAGRTLDNDLNGEFATVVVAVYDPRAGTLRYSSAGHPPPILLGPGAHEPVTVCSSPPVGVSPTTGMRQTTVPLPQGATACFFTDGLLEARIGDELLGRERLEALVERLGPEGGADTLLERVREISDRAADDMAACLLRPRVASVVPGERVEELEAEPTDLAGRGPREFLAACGVDVAASEAAVSAARRTAAETGRALLRVTLNGDTASVEVVPAGAETLEQVAVEPAPLPGRLA